MFWNQQVETLAKIDMLTWQNHKLCKLMERVYEKSSLYNKRMQQCGLQPTDIISVADLVNLPFTTQQDVKDNYPYGLLTMPISGVSYIHRKQVEHEQPTAVSYTQHDMFMWTEVMSRILVAGGLHLASVFQVAIEEQYSGSTVMQLGARQVGATVAPATSQHVKKQITLMEDFGVTGIAAAPEYLLALAEDMRQSNKKIAELPLQMLFCDMQSLADNHSQQIQDEYGLQLLKIYGLGDIFGMSIGGECHCADGIHIQEDCFYPEIVHPVNGQVLPIGQSGELLLTTLTLEAMPLIRYRTAMRGYLVDNQCACGRTLVRFKQG